MNFFTKINIDCSKILYDSFLQFNNCVLSGKYIRNFILHKNIDNCELMIQSFDKDNFLLCINNVRKNMDDDVSSNFFHILNDKINLYLDKKVYDNENSIVEKFCNDDYKTCFIIVKNYICETFVHPVIHYHMLNYLPLEYDNKLIKTFDLHDLSSYEIIKKELDVNYKNIRIILLPIIQNNFNLFKINVDNSNNIDSNKKSYLNDIIIKTCVYLRRLDMFNYFTRNITKKTKNILLPNTIKYIIDNDDTNNCDYVKILCECHNLNICFSSGLNPFEHIQNNKIIKLLSPITYTRNPKYWCFINRKSIFNYEPLNEFEKELYPKLTNIRTIDQLNNIIINVMINKCMLCNIKDFCLIHDKHINYNNLIDDIIKSNRMDVSIFLNDIIYDYCNKGKYENEKVMFKILSYYICNKRYDLILKYKEIMNKNRILEYVIDSCDIDGLIFLLEYIDKELIKYEDESENNLIHKLCLSNTNANINNDTRIKMIIVVHHYESTLINMKNKNNIVPLFLTVNNKELNDFILSMCSPKCIEEKTTENDTYLHYIVKFGCIEVLKQIIITNIEEQLKTLNNKHEIPLMIACKLKKTDMFNILIDHSDESTIDEYGNTIDHYITLYGQFDMNKKRINNTNNSDGYNPSDYMIYHILNKIKNEK